MRPRRLHVLIPDASTTIIDPDGERRVSLIPVHPIDTRRVAANIDRLVTREGGRRAAAVVIVPPGPPAGAWPAVISAMTVPALAVSRPLVAVSGLGLAAGSGRMVIDRREEGVDISVVTEEGVIATEYRQHDTLAEVASAVHSAFVGIDPDLEWAIRTEGVDVLTHGFDEKWSRGLAARLGIDLRVIDDPLALLQVGVRADRAAIERCLETTPSRAPRRPFPADITHRRRSAASF